MSYPSGIDAVLRIVLLEYSDQGAHVPSRHEVAV